MSPLESDGRAIVYCEGEYGNANGKTAHGLVRHTKRYEVLGVVDSTMPEGDAGEKLDGIKRDIPLFSDIEQAIKNTRPEVFVVGAVSEGGELPPGYKDAVLLAIEEGLEVVSGLHQFLSDMPDLKDAAKEHGVRILDVRKVFRDYRRFYTGEIKDVESIRIAMLGTDSAIGKRTTGVLLVEELLNRGLSADLIFTGQTGWMQGWPHGVIMDALINDFVSGGIEGAILESWRNDQPEFMIIEGQGSLVHPFFPGGFEIMAAGQIHGFVIQDAPKRPSLDGFPDYPMPNPDRVIKIAEMLSERPLIGMALNHENMERDEVKRIGENMELRYGVPVEDPIWDGVSNLADAVENLWKGD